MDARDRKILEKARDEAYEVAHHFHTLERWYGISADQSGNDWAADTLNPFQAISGNGDYGSDANDEAKVLGTDDTPFITGEITYDLHRILIVDVSEDTEYKLRVVYDDTDMATGIAAGRYTEVMVNFDSTNPQQSAGVPVDLLMPKLTAGLYKVWIQCKNATDNATIDFYVGGHGYTR